MVYYAKISVSNPLAKVLALFQNEGIPINDIILDYSAAPKAVGSMWHNLKEELTASREPLTIDSVQSLGKNNREISKELDWFKNNGLELHILNLPSHYKDSTLAINVLSELYANLAAVEIENVKKQQRPGNAKVSGYNKPLGRGRIPYPSNWEEAYGLWSRKEITAVEFMSMTGLKKGTLYNLIKQYKEQQQKAQKEA